MKKTEIFDLFPAEYRDLILHYKDALKKIFENYQVVIFMARKAICFYKSLVISGFIDKPEDCKVYSSRILTYNVKELFKEKKVVVIDDVMIRGGSIKESLNILKSYNILADVYIMARPEVEHKDVLYNFNVIDTYAELSKEDTLSFSKYIANFIEANMCPYNIDQPIYSFDGFDDNTIELFIKEQNLIEISSDLQNSHDIKSYVLKVPNSCFEDTALKEYVDLCKIRFLYGKYDGRSIFLAIPFVLLGEITVDELNEAFSYYENEELKDFIYNTNNQIINENKLKILHYALAAELMAVFISVKRIKGVHRLNSNDDYVFSKKILNNLNINQKHFKFSDDYVQNNNYSDRFKMNEYLGLTFDFLYSEDMQHKNYCDSDNNCINSELLLISNLKLYIKESLNTEIDELVFSNVIDILIDKGMIIPSIIHGENSTIIRAYKCGEVYALNREHFKLFTYALCEYMKGINHDKLQKTEFEKLCVLFFREAVDKGILRYGKATDEEDEYSICYSKFGPRVSTSKPIYSANETSTLASKLLNLHLIDMESITISCDKTLKESVSEDEPHSYMFNQISYYYPDEIDEGEIENLDWKNVAINFARRYKLIYKSMFNEDDGEIIFNNVRNMYIRSYTELLTMLAIGTSKKNQLLSLLAEIYLLESVDFNTNNIIRILFQCNRILDGLISGMWKYMCYVQTEHPLQKIQKKLEVNENTEHIGVFIGDAMRTERDTDKNEHIAPLIKDTGMLIFSIVYSIWFMSKKYRVSYKIRGEYINLEQNKRREFYFEQMKDIRQFIENQIKYSNHIQDLQQLYNLKDNAQKILNRYKQDIAEGKRQERLGNKTEFNEAVGVVNIFEKGGKQYNGNNF